MIGERQLVGLGKKKSTPHIFLRCRNPLAASPKKRHQNGASEHQIEYIGTYYSMYRGPMHFGRRGTPPLLGFVPRYMKLLSWSISCRFKLYQIYNCFTSFYYLFITSVPIDPLSFMIMARTWASLSTEISS